MSPVVTIAGVELRRFIRDRSNIFFVFVFPMVLVLLIGSQFGGEGPAGSVTIAGPDGALRTQITAELRAEGVEVSYDDADTLRDSIARGRADVGLFLDAEADRDFAAAEVVDLDVVTASQATSQVVLQRVSTAIRQVETGRGQRAALTQAGVPTAEVADLLRSDAAVATPPQVEVTDVNAISQEFRGLGQFDLGAATQMLLFVFLSSLTGASTLILSRRQGVLTRTIAAPLTVGQALAGQALGRFTLAMVQGLYLMLGTTLLFDVNWGSWPASLAVLVAFAAVASAAAMVIGSVMDNDGAAAGIGIGAGLVLAALGGCMTPLEFFPDSMRTIAHVTPHAWAYEAFAEIQRQDGGVLDVLPQLGVLTAMAAVLLALGTWLLRRSLDRAL